MRFSGINKRQAESIFVSDLVPKISQSMFLFFSSDVNLKQDFETQEVSESVKAKQQKLFSALKYLFLSTIHLGRLVEMICANIVGQMLNDTSSSGPNTWFFGRKKHQHDDIPSIFPLNPTMFSWSNHHQTMVVLSFSKGFVPWFYAFSHGFPMFFLWFSHGFMLFPIVFLCFSYGFPMVLCFFPIVFLCFSYGFPMVLCFFPMVFLCFSYGFPMVLCFFPWFPYVFPMVFPWFYVFSHGFPMFFLWFSHGFMFFSPWFSYVFPMVFPWFYVFSLGFPMFFLWFSHGFMFFPMVFLCFPMVFLRFNSSQGHHRLRGGAIRPVPRLHGRAGPGWPGVRGILEDAWINGFYTWYI